MTLHRPQLPASRNQRGLTIPELLVVLTILCLLGFIGYNGYQKHIEKAESIDAIAKLQSMHAALNTYLIDKQTWPQEPDDDQETVSEEALWDWWQKEMKPYGLSEDDWYSTAHLRRINRALKEAGGKPVQMTDMGKLEELKYPSILPGNFPPGATEPYRYRGQPWVSETGEYHGDEGIYTIMPDRKIHVMKTTSQMNKAQGKGEPGGKK